MTLETIYYLSQTIAVMAIIGSLIFLGLQVRRAERVQRSASLSDILDAYSDRTNTWLVTEPEVADLMQRGLHGLKYLNRIEKTRFGILLAHNTLQMQRVMELHERTYITDTDFRAWMDFTLSILRTKGGSEIWSDQQRTVSPTITELLNRELRATPDGPTYLDLIPMLQMTERELKDAFVHLPKTPD